MSEPKIHSHRTDVLEDDNPLAYKDVHCTECDRMLHAHNNECMRTWVECPEMGNLCVSCFAKKEEE